MQLYIIIVLGDDMRTKLIEDINNYIAYLNNDGLLVSVHGRTIGGLLEYNIHKNPFCTFVKTNDEAWRKCVKCQKKVYNKYSEDCFLGMCYAGVEEYVFFADEKTFISVSGYGINKEKAIPRINSLSTKFCFDKNELMYVYDEGLKHTPENENELRVKIKPLCHMISLLNILAGDVLQENSKSKTFDSILSFVQKNVSQDITIRDIAAACACSESTVSHLFKEHTGKSVKQYILDLRIKQAERLLLSSGLDIGNVALLCGFSNTNYFSTAFKKLKGISPSKFRGR